MTCLTTPSTLKSSENETYSVSREGDGDKARVAVRGAAGAATSVMTLASKSSENDTYSVSREGNGDEAREASGGGAGGDDSGTPRGLLGGAKSDSGAGGGGAGGGDGGTQGGLPGGSEGARG